MKLEINYRKKTAHFSNMWRLNNMLLNNQVDQQKNQRRNQKHLETNEKWKYNMPKSMGCSKSSSRRKAQSDAGLPKETRKISRKQSNFTPKGTRKRTNEAHSK